MRKKKKRLPDKWLAVRHVVLALGALLLVQGAAAWAVGFTSEFRPEDCAWRAGGTQNPYFSLRPGYQLTLAGEDDEGTEIVSVTTMLREKETITFDTPDGNTVTVRTRVMEERESEDGELVEVSRNWVARCAETSDIFYFGEEVDIYEDGEIVSHEGAWRAGEDGAQPGILMPGRFLLGAKYFQEVAPDVALDRAKHIAMGLDVEVPAGSFGGCVAVKETNALEPGADPDFKIYCPGVGIVMDEELELVEFGMTGP